MFRRYHFSIPAEITFQNICFLSILEDMEQWVLLFWCICCNYFQRRASRRESRLEENNIWCWNWSKGRKRESSCNYIKHRSYNWFLYEIPTHIMINSIYCAKAIEQYLSLNKNAPLCYSLLWEKMFKFLHSLIKLSFTIEAYLDDS